MYGAILCIHIYNTHRNVSTLYHLHISYTRVYIYLTLPDIYTTYVEIQVLYITVYIVIFYTNIDAITIFITVQVIADIYFLNSIQCSNFLS